jgi:hypothetical protein
MVRFTGKKIEIGNTNVVGFTGSGCDHDGGGLLLCSVHQR